MTAAVQPMQQQPDAHSLAQRMAQRYGLDVNRELFAYRDPKSGLVVPVVSVDGWARIVNAQPAR